MTKPNTIARNTSILMAGRFVQRGLSFFTTVLIVRYLGPAKYGQYTLVITLVTLGSVLWDFGLNTLITRDVARDDTIVAQYTGDAILIKSVFMIPVLLFMLLYIEAIGYSKIIFFSICLFTISTFLNNLSGIFHAVFYAFRRMEYSAILDTLKSAVLLLLLSFLIYYTSLSAEITEVFICYFLSIAITFFLTILFFKRNFVLPVFSSRIETRMHMCKLAFPFLLTSMVNLILFRIDHLMLSKMSGDIALGLYGSVYTIFEVIISFFPMLIMTSSFPVLAGFYHSNRGRMTVLINMLLKYFLLLSLPMSCGLILMHKEIITVLFGPEYKEAGLILAILGGSVPVFFLTSLISWTLTAADKQKSVLLSNLIAMIMNILLNLYFIPLYGGTAAASSTLLCELFQLLYMAVILRKIAKILFVPNLFRASTACLLMTCFIVFIRKYFPIADDFVALIFIVPLAATVYFTLAYIFRAFQFQELRSLLSS